MPARVRVTVHEARNLPVMDALSGLTDAYVELKIGTQQQRTETARKTLHPASLVIGVFQYYLL